MPRPVPLPQLLELGPFRTGEALLLGVPASRLRAQDLHAPFHGVRTTAASDALVDRCRAYAVLMPAGQYFSHATAAQLWGLPVPESLSRDARLHVSTPGREPHGRGVQGHRIASVADLRFVEELPVLAPADAWCQLGSAITGDDLVAAGDRLLGWPEPLADEAEIDAAIARFRGRRGARAVALARRRLRRGSASDRETRLRLLVVRAGFPEPEPNGQIVLPDGRTTHGDLVFRQQRTILEYDGDRHRTDRRRFRRDVDRLNALAVAGWLVIRIHGDTPPGQVIELLDAALRRRS